MKTIKNKLVALALLLLSLIPVSVDHDGTILLWIAPFCIAFFLAKRPWIE